MKKILLIALLALSANAFAQESVRVDKDYPNAWTLRGQTELKCNAIVVVLFDKNGRFIEKFTCRNEFGTFKYTADPNRFTGWEGGTFKIKCY